MTRQQPEKRETDVCSSLARLVLVPVAIRDGWALVRCTVRPWTAEHHDTSGEE